MRDKKNKLQARNSAKATFEGNINSITIVLFYSYHLLDIKEE